MIGMPRQKELVGHLLYLSTISISDTAKSIIDLHYSQDGIGLLGQAMK